MKRFSRRQARPGKRLVGALVSVLAAVAVAGCGGGDSATLEGGDVKLPTYDLEGEKIRITFGDASAQSLGNQYMADQLQKWGAEVDEITLTTATGLSAIVAGRADFAAGQGADEALLGRSNGTDVTAIGAPDSANSYVIVARKDVADVEDLKGKRIATSGPGGFNTALAHVALRESGVAEKDVDFVTIGGSPERSAALLTGQVDATVIFFADWAAISDRSEDVKLLARMSELVPDIPDLYYYGKAEYWKEHPEVAEAVACANLQANAIIASDKEAFVDFAAKSIEGSDKEVLASTYDELKKIGNWPTEPDEIMNAGGLDGLVELMIQSGTIDEPVETDGLVDPSYLEKAAEKGCGETA